MPFVEPISQIPAPYRDDAPDWRQVWALAAAADQAQQQVEAALIAAARPPSFLLRTTADSSSTLAGQVTLNNLTADWLNSGSLPGTSFWKQAEYEAPSRYVIGVFVQTKVTAGVAGAASPVLAWPYITTLDPISGTALTYNGGFNLPQWGIQETGSGGDYLSFQFIPPIVFYKATVSAIASFATSGTAQRAVAAGARLWGWRVGDA